MNKLFFRLTVAAVLLTLVVVVLGAYVRLSDAGLGCPDWPGCYGKLIVPSATDLHPDRPLEPHKAWKEMVHRYAAGTLGLLIAALAVMGWRQRHIDPTVQRIALALLGVVVFQALLGMWTVTLLLHPLVVLAHLFGGLTTLSLLTWLLLLQRKRRDTVRNPGMPQGLRPLAAVALLVVVAQIGLGGWTSANYATLACPDFPACQGAWWPEMDFRQGFHPWPAVGAATYEFGVLDMASRTAIHLTHRLGAVAVLLLVGALALVLLRSHQPLRKLGIILTGALLLQISLGIANVLLQLPLATAVAHNGGAALLLLVLLTVNFQLRQPAFSTFPAPARLRPGAAEQF